MWIKRGEESAQRVIVGEGERENVMKKGDIIEV